MKRKNISILIFVFFASFLCIFISCENIDDTREKEMINAKLDISSNIIKLVDDSTNIAGYIEVTSSASELSLKWNFPPECNIDTTSTKFNMNEGICRIPIKWDGKDKAGVYGPICKAFDGGVLISAGHISKYVHLIWADKIDSTLINTGVVTRSGDDLPGPVDITLTPKDVNMDIVAGGSVTVDFSGTNTVAVDQHYVAISTNINKSKIPTVLIKPETIYLDWVNGKAPDTDFRTRLDFKAGGIVETCYIDYTVPFEEPLIWEFLNSSSTDGGDLPATNATVSIKVKTNKPWSIESTTAEISPVPDYGTGIGIKILTLHIKDNPGPDPRPVSVLVKSQGVLKEALIFNQLSENSDRKVLEFISSDPEHGATIPSIGTNATIKVKTNASWWIELNGSRTTFPMGTMGEKIGSIAIPANTSPSNQIVSYMIGYDNAIAKTISYIQSGQGSDIGTTLQYESSNLPTGNIPAEGGTYTFTFTGDYTGNFEIRVLDANTNEVIYNGPIGTTHTPKVTVTANAAVVTRNVKFQYKKTDVASEQWTDLPISTNRIQDAKSDGGGETGTVRPGTLVPEGDLSEYGDNCSCKFDGDFTGTIIMRAKAGEQELTRSIGKVNSTITVQIPKLDGMDRNITFEYSLDNGNTWIPMGSKQQINEIFLPSGLQPVVDRIPVEGGEFSWNYRGTYSKEVKFEVATVEPDGTYNVLLLQSSHSAHTFYYTVPANKGMQRAIGFRYKEETKESWTIIRVLLQDGVK